MYTECMLTTHSGFTWANPEWRVSFPSHLVSLEGKTSLRNIFLMWCHPCCRQVLAGTLAPRDVSMAAWAVAKLGLPDAPALLGALAERAAACAGCFSPLDLSLLLWAAAAGGVVPGCTLFADLAADAALLGDQLAPRNLAMVAWAYGTTAARLRSGDATHGVLTALRPHAVAAAPALTPQVRRVILELSEAYRYIIHHISLSTVIRYLINE